MCIGFCTGCCFRRYRLGHCLCSCCSFGPSRVAAKFLYGGMFLASVIVAWVLRGYATDALYNLYSFQSCEPNNPGFVGALAVLRLSCYGLDSFVHVHCFIPHSVPLTLHSREIALRQGFALEEHPWLRLPSVRRARQHHGHSLLLIPRAPDRHRANTRFLHGGGGGHLQPERRLVRVDDPRGVDAALTTLGTHELPEALALLSDICTAVEETSDTDGGTSGLGLVLGGRGPVVLTGHADASWVDDLATQRSSQGYTFSLGPGSVSWRSTRSSSVISSSCEAEIYAGAMAAQDTSGLGLVLGGRGPVVLTGHADASWVDDLATQRSSQGYTFSLGPGSVSWRSTRSSSVISSSCEAEIYAGAMAAQELRWLT
ncbi:unnamed protein product [Closterium sp. NIES-53]